MKRIGKSGVGALFVRANTQNAAPDEWFHEIRPGDKNPR